MISQTNKPSRLAKTACVALWVASSCLAYPPAPDHVFYGMVRDEMGNPINTKSATVYLEASSGTKISTTIVPDKSPGINYTLSAPMDAGITDDLYKPTALRPLVPFRIYVKIGDVTYLPIQMNGDYAKLGQPGQRTRLDLTLGEDTDGDGLPDAWERALIAALGGNKTLQDINPNDDSDGDGLNNREEYYAGNYAFDKQDSLMLKILNHRNGACRMEFMIIKGRSYSIQVSEDFKTWTPISFQIANGNSLSENMLSYPATDIRVIQAEVPSINGTQKARFFKLMVQ